MKKKLLLPLILLLVFAVLLTVGVVLSKGGSGSGSETLPPVVDDSVTLLSGNVTSLVSVEWQLGDGETQTLKKRDSTWQLGNDPFYPLNHSVQSAVTAAAVNVIALRTVALDPPDPASFGFDDPYGTITVNLSGVVTVFEIGDFNSFSSLYYVRVQGKPAVYAVSSDFVGTFSVTKTDLTALDVKPSIDISAVTSIVRTAPDGVTKYLCSKAEDGTALWSDENGAAVEADTATALFALLTSDLYTSHLEAYVSPETAASTGTEDPAYASYGLDGDSRATYTVNYTERVEIPAADEVSTSTYKDVEKSFTLYVGTAEGKTYCCPAGSCLIYGVTAEDLL